MRQHTVSSPTSPHRAVSALQLARMKAQLQRLVCSAPWFDHCWNALGAGRSSAIKRVDDALSRKLLYPPGGRRCPGVHRTLMRRCKGCKIRWLPPQYVRGCGLCEDCVADLQAPPSAPHVPGGATESAMAETLRQLAHYQVRLVEPSLPAEDEASLRREIDAYLALHPEASTSLTPTINAKKHV